MVWPKGSTGVEVTGDIYLLASVAARGVEETSTFARACGRVKTLLGDVVTVGLHAGV